MFSSLLSTFLILNSNQLAIPSPLLATSSFTSKLSSNYSYDYGYEPTDNLVADLRKGGYVIFFRHAAANEDQKDINVDFGNCATQSNLNQRGRDEAKAIGTAFKRLNIPVGTVLASPFCRTLDTAQIAFGKATKSEELISIIYARNKSSELLQALVKMLQNVPSGANNTILVGHGSNLNAVLKLNLQEGGAAIFKPKADRSFVLVGQIQTAKEWEAQVSK